MIGNAPLGEVTVRDNLGGLTSPPQSQGVSPPGDQVLQDAAAGEITDSVGFDQRWVPR